MRSHITLGRVAGISIEINWSVIAIAALVTFTLATGLLPLLAPGYGSATYLLSGVGGAVALLASIVAHELGHALVARRNGIAVENITLWAFGGVAQLAGEVDSPQVELKVAGIGPAISLTVGAIAIAPAFWANGLVAAMFAWLGGINLMLAVFNLIPGAPLDGGRLLHALLWRRHGDRRRATRTAARAGRVVGFALVSLGIYQIFIGTIGGLWTILIGWFLQVTASAEERQSQLTADLEGLTVHQIMNADGNVVPEWLSVGSFLERHEHNLHHAVYLTVDFGGDVAGVLPIERLAKVPASERYGVSIRTVAQSADELAVVDAADPASAILPGFSQGPMVIVVDGSTPLGVVTAADIARVARTAGLFSRLRRD